MPENRVACEGRLLKTDGLRHTPAGIATLRLWLQHDSTQVEAGSSRRVSCEIEAVAFGSIAEHMARLPTGAQIRTSGFLDRKGLRYPALIVHLTEFELIKE